MSNNVDSTQLREILEKARETAACCSPYYFDYWQKQAHIEDLYNTEYTNKKWKKMLWIGLPVVAILGIVLSNAADNGWAFDIMIVLWIAFCLYVKSVTKKKNESKLKDNAKEIDTLKQQQAQLLEQALNIYEKSEVSGCYPQEYLFEDAVEQMIMYVKVGRADSLKECINLYEETLHRMRVEENQNQQNQALMRAEALQRKSNNALTFAAAMSAAAVLTRRR